MEARVETLFLRVGPRRRPRYSQEAAVAELAPLLLVMLPLLLLPLLTIVTLDAVSHDGRRE